MKLFIVSRGHVFAFLLISGFDNLPNVWNSLERGSVVA